MAQGEKGVAGSGEIMPRRERRWRGLRWTLIGLTGIVFAPVLVVGVVVVAGIPMDVSWLRPKIESVASAVLDRRVVLEGPITLLPTLRPTVQVEGVRVGNPPDWPEGDIARLELARAGLAVLPLLSGEVRIDEIAVKGLRAELETDAEGNVNWLLGAPAAGGRSRERRAAPALEFVELGELSVQDIRVTHRDASTDSPLELKFYEITGSAIDNEPLQLFVRGAVEGDVQTAGRREHYALTLTGGSLSALLAGDEPWPLDVSVAFLDLNLAATGQIEEPMRFRGVEVDFHLGGPMMGDLGALVGTKLPPVRSMDLRGRIVEQEGAYELVDLEGQVGRTAFSAAFKADLSGQRPRFEGNIDVPSIDIGPFYAALAEAGLDEQTSKPREATEHAEDEDTEFDLDEPLLVLEPLQRFDAEFTLALGEVVNASTSLRDASLQVRVEDGRITSPMAVTYAEVPFNGNVAVALENDEPAVEIALWADRSDIGELARWLTRAEGIEGAFDRVELGVTARGESARALVESTELTLSIADAALSYGHDTDGKPVEFTLERADAHVPARGETRVSARGTLLGQPIALELAGGNFLENLVGRSWPVDLRATGSGAELRVRGRVAGRRAEAAAADLHFDLAGEQIGDLGRWLALSPEAKPSYQLSGQLGVNDGQVAARIDEGRIGNTRFKGEAGLKAEQTQPVTVAALEFELIDLDEIASLVRDDEHQRDPENATPFTIDVPIMPKGIELFDSDIDLKIHEVAGAPGELAAIELSSRIRGGTVVDAPFRATVAGSVFAGALSADLRGEIPMVDFRLGARTVNIGKVLTELGVTRGLEMTSDEFKLALALRGVSPRDLLRQSSFSASLRNGAWRIDDPNLEGSVEIGFPHASVTAEADKPITLSVDGRIDQTPIEITVSTDSLASFADEKTRLRMDVAAALAGSNIKLSGRAPLPVQASDLHFTLDFRGESFSDFDELLDVSLPPWGPYELSGDFGTRESGYYVERLVAKVGESTLKGRAALETARNPPRLSIDLDAESIQLDDFDTRGWSALAGEEAVANESAERAVSDGGERDLEQVRAILSPEVMRSVDGAVKIDVRQVFSGKDRLGDGTLTATLENGKLEVDPLTVSIPGGSTDVAFAIEPTEIDVGLTARAKIEQLDYGILARRIDPESDVGGIISVDVDIDTRGPELERAMYGSNGHVDFAVWPEDLNAGIFDLWAVNLLIAVLPSLDSDSASKINCVVGRFRVEDGIMRPTALLIDSSRIQASGDGVIDFKKGTIDFLAAPRPKRPQLFSAQTPIEVKGELADFEVGLPPGAVAQTTVRVVTSPVVVPFQWVFTEQEPADGQVACQRAWGRP